MRLVSVLLMLGLCVGMAYAAPDGVDEKPWSYPEGMFGDRDTYPEQEPNDACDAPQAVVCGDVVDPGELVAADRDWYSFTVEAGQAITVGTDESIGLGTVDTYLELYADDCVTQLAYNDDGGPGLYSLIDGFVAPYTGTYNALVRGYNDASTGFYLMFVTCEDPPPPSICDNCDVAEADGCVIERCTAGTVEGTTVDNTNNYSPTNGCTGYSQAAGLDEVFVMDLEAGDVCDFYYYGGTNDKAFYILTDCADMNSCVVGADDPEEILGWEVPATGRYFLVLDGYSSGDTGDIYVLDYMIGCAMPGACCYGDQLCVMALEGECYDQYDGYLWIPDEVCEPNPCPPIATENSTWGSIKATYR